MSKDTTPVSGSNNSSDQVPQVIYTYPVSSNSDDEIDLGAFLAKLASHYKLIVGIIFIGTLLSVVIALMLPNVYRQEVILSTPNKADMAKLNSNGLIEYEPLEVFKLYYESLRSPNLLEHFIKENNFLDSLYDDITGRENILIEKFQKNLFIEILETQSETESESNSHPKRISVKAEHENEEVIANLLNQYTAYVESNFIESLVGQQKSLINAELNQINTDIDLLRAEEKLRKENEIIQVENKIQQEIAGINSQLDALKIKAKTDTEHELIAIASAYDIAKKLNIKKPTTITGFGRNLSQATSMTEITVNDRQELPLYLMGTAYLDAKREELKTRVDNTPFIKEYSELKEQIILLENDSVLASLKGRKNDDPYIESLPELINKKQKLSELSLDFDGVKVVKIEKNAKIYKNKIKPKRVLIVTGGAVLSCIIALLVGVLTLVLTNRDVKI